MQYKLRFRVWDNERTKWVPGCQIRPTGTVYQRRNRPTGFGDEDYYVEMVPPRYVIERSVGWHDKKGYLICEGDILRLGKDESFWRKYKQAQQRIPEVDRGPMLDPGAAVVLLQPPRFWLVGEMFGKGGSLLVSTHDCEVIGNIHEHPHLLAKTS